jgi:hypothetical protein
MIFVIEVPIVIMLLLYIDILNDGFLKLLSIEYG